MKGDNDSTCKKIRNYNEIKSTSQTAAIICTNSSNRKKRRRDKRGSRIKLSTGKREEKTSQTLIWLYLLGVISWENE